MPLDETHRKLTFYGSAVVAGILLEVLTSPGFHLSAPRYAPRNVAGQICIVDEDSGTFAPSPDGMPICYPASPKATAASHG